MPTVIFAILVRLVIGAIGGFGRRARTPAPNPLCSECAFAHIQFGACGRRAISCTFGGGLRPIKLDVLYCTDYRNRVVPVRPAIGFVRSIGVGS